jgi:hypothetical protein
LDRRSRIACPCLPLQQSWPCSRNGFEWIGWAGVAKLKAVFPAFCVEWQWTIAGMRHREYANEIVSFVPLEAAISTLWLGFRVGLPLGYNSTNNWGKQVDWRYRWRPDAKTQRLRLRWPRSWMESNSVKTHSFSFLSMRSSSDNANGSWMAI